MLVMTKVDVRRESEGTEAVSDVAAGPGSADRRRGVVRWRLGTLALVVAWIGRE